MLFRVLESARPPFLILGPLVVGLGVAAAVHQGVDPDWVQVVIVLIVMVAGHVSANAFNEYFDFHSGLDASTERTPFSGGSGLLPTHPSLAPAVHSLAWTSLLLAVGLGLWLARAQVLGLAGLGGLGVALVYGYTRWLHRWPMACYLAPGLGFGAVVYLGTSLVMSGQLDWLDAYLAVIVGLLANNLLLLNQFPDIEADRRVGRRHFPIVIGRRASAVLHAVSAVLVFVLIIAMIVQLGLSAWVALGLLPALLLIPIFAITLGHPDDLSRLLPALGLNVVMTLGVPLLLSIGLALAT